VSCANTPEKSTVVNSSTCGIAVKLVTHTMRRVQIAPSILAADFAKLGEEIRALDTSGADYIHIDVMDGHFVPNLTMGANIVHALRPHTKLPLDVHLMIAPVYQFISDFAESGADIITIHVEADPHPRRIIDLIQSHGIKAGIAIKPSTPSAAIDHLLDYVDLVLVMTVNPGFGGQEFMPSQLKKLKTLRKTIDDGDRDVLLEVDGGVTLQTAQQAVTAGADILVAGTASFSGGPTCYATNIAALRGLVAE